MALLAASSLQFLSKPFMFQIFGGPGASPQDYLSTTYAMFSQSLGTVFGIAVALTLLVILMRDVLSEAAARSETDPLSGLFNRGGFEQQADIAIRAARRLGMPVSLVIADLDRFKSINDTFGHVCRRQGDRRASPTSCARPWASIMSAGRIGGEEFAMLLPGTNLVAARLFAEGARSTFAGTTIEGLPDTKHVTASFGVAELMAGESYLRPVLARRQGALSGQGKRPRLRQDRAAARHAQGWRQAGGGVSV